MLNDVQIAEAWELLKDTPLIKVWPEFKADYLPRLDRSEKRSGEQITREGDPASDFFILGSGTAQGLLRRGGQSWLQWEFTPGQCFGQAALYLNQRQFEVRANTPAILYRLRPFDLRGAIERNAKLQEFLLRQELGSRLRRLPLLRSLDDATLFQIAPLVNETDIADGGEIALPPTGGLWIIESGQVAVTGPAALERSDWCLTAGNFFVAAGAGVRFGQNCMAGKATVRHKAHLLSFSADHLNALASTFEDVRALVQRPMDIVRCLAAVEPLKNLSLEERQHLAQFCGWMFVPAGQNLTTQGQPGYGLVILRDGEAVVVAVDDRGRPRPRNYLRAPAAYGETSLFQGKEHDATVRAVTTPAADGRPRLDGADIIVLDRRDLSVAFQEQPQMWAEHPSLVQRSAQMKQEAQPYDWMQDGEKLQWRGRAHWLWLALPESAVALVVLLLVGITLLAPLSARDEVAVFTMLVSALFILPFAVFIAYNYFDDYYAITNRRVTRRDHLILVYESRTETPLEMVQDTTYDANFWGRLFDYGDVNVRSAAKVGSIKFQHVPHPNQVRARIQFERAEATAGLRGQQHERLRKDVMAGLRLAVPIPEVGRALGTSARAPIQRGWWAGLRGDRGARRPNILPATKGGMPAPFVRWANRLPEQWRRVLIGDTSPAVQIELKEGEFLWRKHPIQLILQAGRPLALLLLWIIIGWGLFSLDLGLNRAAIDLPWWGVLIILLGWIWWEYADYRNDLYILREDRIIDIEATPLWLSIKRREGNLDRVQNVVARQKGIWQNLLNYGDVDIQTAAIDEGFNFSKIADPQLVQVTIFQKLDVLKNRQAERQMRDRQREIIEGLDVYHELRSEGHNI